MLPRKLILQLCERYSQDDILVLKDWCEENEADEAARLLESLFLDGKATVVVNLRALILSTDYPNRMQLVFKWEEQLLRERKEGKL